MVEEHAVKSPLEQILGSRAAESAGTSRVAGRRRCRKSGLTGIFALQDHNFPGVEHRTIDREL